MNLTGYIMLSVSQFTFHRCGCKRSVVLLQQWMQSLEMEYMLNRAVTWPLWRPFPCDWSRWRTSKRSRNPWRWCRPPSKYNLIELCYIPWHPVPSFKWSFVIWFCNHFNRLDTLALNVICGRLVHMVKVLQNSIRWPKLNHRKRMQKNC